MTYSFVLCIGVVLKAVSPVARCRSAPESRQAGSALTLTLDVSRAASGRRGAEVVFVYGRQFPFDPLVVQDVRKFVLLHLQDGGGLSTGAPFSAVVTCDPFSSFL